MDRELSADVASIIVTQDLPSLDDQPLTESEDASTRPQNPEDMHMTHKEHNEHHRKYDILGKLPPKLVLLVARSLKLSELLHLQRVCMSHHFIPSKLLWGDETYVDRYHAAGSKFYPYARSIGAANLATETSSNSWTWSLASGMITQLTVGENGVETHLVILRMTNMLVVATAEDGPCHVWCRSSYEHKSFHILRHGLPVHVVINGTKVIVTCVARIFDIEGSLDLVVLHPQEDQFMLQFALDSTNRFHCVYSWDDALPAKLGGRVDGDAFDIQASAFWIRHRGIFDILYLSYEPETDQVIIKTLSSPNAFQFTHSTIVHVDKGVVDGVSMDHGKILILGTETRSDPHPSAPVVWHYHPIRYQKTLKEGRWMSGDQRFVVYARQRQLKVMVFEDSFLQHPAPLR
ncbi:F-box domain protein [Penicillium sp. IBT 18751x]|nr:F-box domain protein [Penicillium sp. IBT 18751x]